MTVEIVKLFSHGGARELGAIQPFLAVITTTNLPGVARGFLGSPDRGLIFVVKPVKLHHPVGLPPAHAHDVNWSRFQ